MDRIYIKGGNRLEGSVEINGAKNAVLPLMVAALLSSEPTTLFNVPDLNDVETMRGVLEDLGAKISKRGNSITIDPSNFNNSEAPYEMVRKMRASVYVMGPMLAKLHKARVSLPGGCAIGPRPIDLHLKGFEALGTKILLSHGYILAENQAPTGADISLEGSRGSSVGATCNVLMLAVLSKGKSILRGIAKEPEVVELCNFLNQMGARIMGAGTDTLFVEGVEELKGVEYTVIPDRIEAGTYMVAAAITKGNVLVKNCRLDHLDAVINKLREIGVTVTPEASGARVNVEGDLKPVSIRTLPYPGFPTDMQAQFMALLTLVPGESKITETIYPDRFIHASEITRMGADISVMNGTAIIRGVDYLSGAPIMASDLRASAALVLAGLAARGETEVLRVYHIDRGYEKIEAKLSMLGAYIERQDTKFKRKITDPFKKK